MTAKEQGLPEGLAADIDTMRDVYMLPSQRGAYERILARAATYKSALASDTGERGVVDVLAEMESLGRLAGPFAVSGKLVCRWADRIRAALRAQPDGVE